MSMESSLSAREHWFGDHRYSHQRKCLIRRDGKEVPLRPQTLAVFCHLAEHPDVVVSKEELFAKVWPNLMVTDDSLVQCVREIRQALGESNRQVLRTVPKQGYLLSPDAPDAPNISLTAPSTATSIAESMPAESSALNPPSSATSVSPAPVRNRQAAIVATSLGLLLALAAVWVVLRPQLLESSVKLPSPTELVHASTLQLQLRRAEGAHDHKLLDAVFAELRVALSRYPTVRLQESPESDYRLVVSQVSNVAPPRLTVEAYAANEDRVIFAETYDMPEGKDGAHIMAVRIAAFASPGGGGLSRHLMAQARHKPVEKLSRAECYAHGYGCTTCSGEVETISTRALLCLDAILQKDPNDATAWALKSTVHANQWRFGHSLAEPERSDLLLRASRTDMAVTAANRAEALTDGANSAVYWGMSQAYFVKCDIDRMRASVQRGLRINADDPSLLAVFGNWLIYAGQLEEGQALLERALTIEPRHYLSWWLFGTGARHFYRGEYLQSHAAFTRSFNDRNWLSQLHMAYTLPLIGRVDEGREAVKKLLYLNPGFTVEKALQFYKAHCFDEKYLAAMQGALQQAGLPSRLDNQSLERIQVPPVRVRRINGYPAEYLDLGKGEPIVFVHGAISDYRAWADFELPISKRQRYIAYSRRCFGSQPDTCSQPPRNFQTYVDDLAAFVESLGTGPVHLVGYSSGSNISSVLAATRPDLVKSATLFELVEDNLVATDLSIADAKRKHTARFAPLTEAVKAGDLYSAGARFLEAVFEQELGTFEDERPGTRRMVTDNIGPTLAVRETGNSGGVLTCELLRSTQVPTLVVVGERTNGYWAAISRRAAECIPGARLSVLPGVKHDGPIRRPTELAEMILAFVEQHKSTKQVAAR
jgi:pimeloyl-ACP methyl ester carboxylesterase/DNA-binding winged helix-turn-helix (wHTH) protein